MRVRREHWIDGETFLYQTDCLYTEDGQVVVARQRGDGSIQFEDISRGIYGCISDCEFLPEAVEQAYLHNRYSLDIDYPLSRELRTLGRNHKHLVPCGRS